MQQSLVSKCCALGGGVAKASVKKLAMGTGSAISKPSENKDNRPASANQSSVGRSVPVSGHDEPVSERQGESRGSTVYSDAVYLPDLPTNLPSPRSAQAPPQSDQTLSRSPSSAQATPQSDQALSRSPSSAQATPQSEQFPSPSSGRSAPIQQLHVLSPSSGNSHYTSGRHTLSFSDSAAVRQRPLSPHTEPLELSTEQKDIIQECLWSIQCVLGLHFDPVAIYDEVEVVISDGGEVCLCENGKARGIYIVESGELDIIAGREIMDILGPGDFCGELSALFRVPQFIKANSHEGVKLLLIPSPVMQENLVGAYMSRKVMMQWCVKRSLIESNNFFESGTLCREIIMNCFKSSDFQQFSDEALRFIANMVKPLLFSKGDVLYDIGDHPVYVYFIARGSIEFFMDGQTETKTVKYSADGYYIGGKELFNGQPMSQQVTALTPLLVIPVGADVLVEVANVFSDEVPKLQELIGLTNPSGVRE